MEATHSIVFERWETNTGGRDVRTRSALFTVKSHAQPGRGFRVFVPLARSALATLSSKLGADHEDAQEIDVALLMYGLRAIQERVRSGAWVDTGSHRVEEVALFSDDVDELIDALEIKRCDYQIPDGRDLYCAAAAPNDETRVGMLGVRTIAPTSRSTCAACNMPDSWLVCSHLHHPQVNGIRTRGAPIDRSLFSAICDVGRPEIMRPQDCQAGKNECWTRLLEPDRLIEAPASHPRALPEAFDYLDTAWRLAMGGQPLLRLGSAAATGDLMREATTREDFQSRMSAVADVLKSLDIPDELLRQDDAIPIDHTLARLRSCLEARLDDYDFARAETALRVLRAATRIRVGMQHEEASGELVEHMTALGVEYPPSDWGRAWTIVRSQITEAVEILAELVRGIAVRHITPS